MKLFSQQFRECRKAGFLTEKHFIPFAEHPECLPLFPGKKLAHAINTGQLKGITALVCGRFGGICESGKEKCRELRGEKK